jgi:hypothetical protein
VQFLDALEALVGPGARITSGPAISTGRPAAIVSGPATPAIVAPIVVGTAVTRAAAIRAPEGRTSAGPLRAIAALEASWITRLLLGLRVTLERVGLSRAGWRLIDLLWRRLTAIQTALLRRLSCCRRYLIAQPRITPPVEARLLGRLARCGRSLIDLFRRATARVLSSWLGIARRLPIDLAACRRLIDLTRLPCPRIDLRSRGALLPWRPLLAAAEIAWLLLLRLRLRLRLATATPGRRLPAAVLRAAPIASALLALLALALGLLFLRLLRSLFQLREFELPIAALLGGRQRRNTRQRACAKKRSSQLRQDLLGHDLFPHSASVACAAKSWRGCGLHLKAGS